MERLDRFELIAELASGGMATVYLARLGGVAGFQRLYAIKRLHPHLEREPEFTQMFLDEARLAARIHHPNVVPILEIGTSDRGYYLVMEYVEGDSAARLYARTVEAGRTLPLPVGLRIILDALSGLHAAHELTDDDGRPLEIVHRDVSPQNILVGVDGTARMIDFGVARATTRLSSTRSGQLKGKMAYMSPEQTRRGPIDRRADVFAMGIVLWETLTFRRLFKGETDAETLTRMLFEPIPSLRSVWPQCPPALDAIVMRALERHPDDRFPTCAEFAQELEGAARDLGALGTARDVAQYMEDVMGAHVSQQRDAVRAWLTRSEPRGGRDSTPPRAPTPIPPPVAESITRIEAARKTEDEGTLSSVSSEVIRLNEGSAAEARAETTRTTLTSPPLPAGAPRTAGGSPRRRVWTSAVVVAVGAAGIALLLTRRAPPPPSELVPTSRVHARAADPPAAESIGLAAARDIGDGGATRGALVPAVAASAPAGAARDVGDVGRREAAARDGRPGGASGERRAASPSGGAPAERAAERRNVAKREAPAEGRPASTAPPSGLAADVSDDIAKNPYR